MEIFSEKHTTPKYSLITVNFRSAFFLGRMLRSLPISFFAEAEVLIVNNDLSESDILKRMFSQATGIRIIEMGRNEGFARACNEGARRSRGSVFLFLNPDVRYIDGPFMQWLEGIRAEAPGIIAPVLIKDGREESWSSGQQVHPIGILVQNIFPFPSFWSWMASKRRGWVSGAALAISKYDFNFLTGFDEQFFLYYEDVDFCRRAIARGMTIHRSSVVRFSHRGGASHESSRIQKAQYAASQSRYIGKYYGSLWGTLFHILWRIRSFSRGL